MGGLDQREGTRVTHASDHAATSHSATHQKSKDVKTVVEA